MRVLIVEDEEMAGRRLERLTRWILGERLLELIRVETIEQAREMIDDHRIDLLLLDLNLHGRDGYSILEEASSRSFQTVIVSAHAESAIRAFELGVTDFVPKPYSETRLRLAIERVSVREPELGDRLAFLAVRRAGTVETIPIAEVRMIRGAGDYSELMLRSGETHLHDKSLTILEKLLPSRFIRVHRSWIVDISEMRELRSKSGSRYSLLLGSGHEIPVGRSRVEAIRAHLA